MNDFSALLGCCICSILPGTLALAVLIRYRRRGQRPAVSAQSKHATASVGATRRASGASPPTLLRRATTRSTSSKAEWVRPGQGTTVGGRSLPGGMVYVGHNLPSVDGRQIEPALIDPRLAVDQAHPDFDGAGMTYWPSYQHISPQARAAYLDWLSRDRPAGAYVGYVFLFFYGLERRVLLDAGRDAETQTEIPVLAAEVERLVGLYRENDSFRAYATRFLGITNTMMHSADPTSLAPPRERVGWDFPVELKLGLARLVADGQAIPPKWALSWVRTHPELSLRTPATRCSAEFDVLFLRRYADRYGAGLLIKRNKTPLTLEYAPASNSFGQPVVLDVGDLPDVTALRAPTNKLYELARDVCDELDAYSRWVGRHDDRSSPAAVALLPRDLAKAAGSKSADAFHRYLESALGDNDIAQVNVNELSGHFHPRAAGALSRRGAEMLSESLARMGYGLEPDTRYSAIDPTLHETAVVFRTDSTEAVPPSDRFVAATVALQLGVVISDADGEISPQEMTQLSQTIAGKLALRSDERTRLAAHLTWLLKSNPILKRIRQRASALDPGESAYVAKLLIAVAGADGSVSATEIRALERAYAMLGLTHGQVHSDLHDMAVTGTPPHAPVPIMRPDPDRGSRAIPPPPVEASRVPATVELDMDKIALVLRDTAAVREVLSVALGGHVEPEAAECESASSEPVEAAGAVRDAGIHGLDQSHARLVAHLAARSLWPRDLFEAAAASMGLMPAGAIEVINSAAYDATGQPLLEGEEELEVDPDVLKELLGG